MQLERLKIPVAFFSASEMEKDSNDKFVLGCLSESGNNNAIVHEGSTIGLFRVEFIGKNLIEIPYIYIFRSFRSKGVGTAVLDLIKKAYHTETLKVYCSSDESENFFTKNGFSSDSGNISEALYFKP